MWHMEFAQGETLSFKYMELIDENITLITYTLCVSLVF